MILKCLAEASPLPFEKYMEICLFHPEYGYYAKGNLPGKKGDYLTSPCVHRVFGATLANQIIEIYEILGKPEDFTIVEAGAGQGYFALDLLNYLNKKGYSFSYFIVEPFEAIRRIQKETLSGFKEQIKWFKGLEDVPEFIGVFFSNELFDSFPVKLVQKEGKSLKEVWIEVDEEGKIREFLKEVKEQEVLKRVEPYFDAWIDGYRTEVCLSIKDFYQVLAKKLKRGAIITIDYGYPRADYYSEERYKGTLYCYYRNRVVESPYLRPGEMDITSHVDFTLLKELGERFDFFTLGFAQQGIFLVSLGIERVLYEISDVNWRDIEALKFLVFPQGFGSSHWVLIQGKGVENSEKPLKGFELSNKAYLL